MKSKAFQAIEDGMAAGRFFRTLNERSATVPQASRSSAKDAAAGRDDTAALRQGEHKMLDVLAAVVIERRRQEALAGKKFPHTCSGHELLNAEKFVILAEELGEVAEALQRPGRLSTAWRAHLRNELIQVAAVAVAWAESLSGSAAVSQTSRSNGKSGAQAPAAGENTQPRSVEEQ